MFYSDANFCSVKILCICIIINTDWRKQPLGLGIGTAVFLNNKSRFKPTLEFTVATYFAHDKVQRLNSDVSNVERLRSMMNVFAGVATAQNTYISFTGGPCFIDGRTLFGIKPSFGFYFSDKQRSAGKISYITIFNQDKITKDDFGTISFGLGVRLF